MDCKGLICVGIWLIRLLEFIGESTIPTYIYL